MVCPVMQKQDLGPKLSDLPYEALYRPWSWSLSSILNVSLLAFIIVFGWKMFKRSIGKRAEKKIVPLRISSKVEDEQLSENRILVIGGCSTGGRALVSALAEEGVGEIDCLDLLIPGEQWRFSCVSRYIQCDPSVAEDLTIALRHAETVYVMPSLSLSDEKDLSSPEHYISLGQDDIVNIVNCCQTKGHTNVRHLVVVTNLADTVRKNGGKGSKVTEMTHLDEGTVAETAVLDAHSDKCSTCIVRSGIVYALLGEGGDIDVETDELCGNVNPEWPFHLVSSSHLAKVVIGAGRQLKTDTASQVYIAYEKTCTGEDHEELCVPPSERTHLQKEIYALRRRKRLVRFDVDDNETRRLLKL